MKKLKTQVRFLGRLPNVFYLEAYPSISLGQRAKSHHKFKLKAKVWLLGVGVGVVHGQGKARLNEMGGDMGATVAS